VFGIPVRDYMCFGMSLGAAILEPCRHRFDGRLSVGFNRPREDLGGSWNNIFPKYKYVTRARRKYRSFPHITVLSTRGNQDRVTGEGNNNWKLSVNFFCVNVSNSSASFSRCERTSHFLIMQRSRVFCIWNLEFGSATQPFYTNFTGIYNAQFNALYTPLPLSKASFVSLVY
jgi:hypothetical protein